MRASHSTFHILKIQIHLIKRINYLEKPPNNQPTMSSSDAQQNEELKKKLEEVNAKNAKLEKELEEVKAEKEKLEKELRELKKDHQQRVNRRRRNLPAELAVEIVDCFPAENAVHFLANVPNRLIIHHCAPRIRRMLKMIDQIITGYARILPATNSSGGIKLENAHQYTPEIDIFLRYSAAKCRYFYILRGFIGYPANFFDNLIKHYYETKLITKAIPYVAISFPLENPESWPASLMQTGEMKLWKWKVRTSKYAIYILRNKHNPDIAFTLWIHFHGDAKCYKQMTGFEMSTMDVQ